MKKIITFICLVFVFTLVGTSLPSFSKNTDKVASTLNYRLVDGTYIIRMDKGQEIMSTLKQFCEEKKIYAATIQGIGAGENLNIGFFNTKTKQYEVKNIKDCVEITSLLGNVTMKNDEPFIHLHITTADSFHSVSGGHLLSGEIALTGEIFVRPLNTKLNRTFVPEMGINTFDMK